MFEHNAIQSVSILIVLIFLGMFLRKWGVIKEEHGAVFARIIINVTIPALIFSSVSMVRFETDKLMLAMVMIITQLVAALLAYITGRVFRFTMPARGALILASTFSSSAFMGYAIIKSVYNNNPEALTDASVSSELGVAMLLFTFGVLIAMHYGKNGPGKHKTGKVFITFLYSPIFVSLVLGIIVSFIKTDRLGLVGESVDKALQIVSNANTFLVALTIGVMLYFRSIKSVWLIVFLAVVIKLLFQPVFAHLQALYFGFPPLWHQIVVIEASMPTAAMTAVFAKKYNCDPELVSILILATFISSCLTMFMMLVLVL